MDTGAKMVEDYDYHDREEKRNKGEESLNREVVGKIDYDELQEGNMKYDRLVYELVLDKLDNINKQITDYYHAHVKPYYNSNRKSPKYKMPNGHYRTSQYSNSYVSPNTTNVYRPSSTPLVAGNGGGSYIPNNTRPSTYNSASTYNTYTSGSTYNSDSTYNTYTSNSSIADNRSKIIYGNGIDTGTSASATPPKRVEKSKYSFSLTKLKAKVENTKADLNEVLNKLAMETVEQSVTKVVEIIKGLDGVEKQNKYVDILWHMLLNKMHTQSNFIGVHIKFLKLAVTHDILGGLNTNLHDILYESLNMLEEANYFELGNGKTKLLNKVSYDFINNKNTSRDTKKEEAPVSSEDEDTMRKDLAIDLEPFEDDVKAVVNEHGQDIHKLETLYNILGKLTAEFIANSQAEKTKLLVTLYKNFQQINDLLQWQPVNMIELNARIYFIIGFFTNNRPFIRCMSRDYYKDIECQMELIKDQNIPTAIKYKVINCVDNIIKIRLAPAMARIPTTNTSTSSTSTSTSTNTSTISRTSYTTSRNKNIDSSVTTPYLKVNIGSAVKGGIENSGSNGVESNSRVSESGVVRGKGRPRRNK